MVFVYRVSEWLRNFVISVLRLVMPKRWFRALRQRSAKAFGNRYYSSRAKKYESTRVAQQSWHAEFGAMEKFADFLGENLAVLDVPVGTGRFFSIYESRSWRISGLDISQDMLREAQEKASNLQLGSPVILEGDARNLPFGDQSVDVVVCFRFLQSIVNFGDAKRIIAEFARVSRKWAVLHLNLRPADAAGSRWPQDDEPMRGSLSLDEAEKMLLGLGFQISKIEGPMPAQGKNEHVLLCEKVSQLNRAK